MLLLSIAVMIGLWYAFIGLWHLNPFYAKSPKDVWDWLTTGPKAAANRHIILKGLETTLTDAALGFVGGMVVAVAVAVVFVLYTSVEDTLMPIALVLRSVPLVALTPLLVLMFGRGLLGAAVIAGLVTFFPTLVNMIVALRGTPPESLDLCRAYGASAVDTLVKVQIPTALPALFASLRIAAPLALVGALLAEWLATGQGLGYGLLNAAASSDYNGLWARVVLITLYSTVIYQLVGIAEGLVMRRFGSAAS